MQFFKDLKVDLEDPVTLLISYTMSAKQQGEYTYEMFKKGCVTNGVDSINKWYSIIPDLRKSLASNSDLFKKVYEFTFEFT